MEKEEMLKEIERLEKEKEKNNGYLEKFDAFKLKVYKDIIYGKKTNENLKRIVMVPQKPIFVPQKKESTVEIESVEYNIFGHVKKITYRRGK
ncbi:MAG: hypothetical protein MR411_02640 [Tenericutes bacterium]|nr:hypothetical protein [Mycoplasmatota bacterium]MDY3801006.1 hypothetical protein [Bacilli bacterium]